jgi:hypothetical protein
MSGNNDIDILKSEYLRIDIANLRRQMFYFRLERFYLFFLRFFQSFKSLYLNICCHWIALRYWFLTGEIMQEYLELLESQRSDSHF